MNHVAIISSGRPNSVKLVHNILGMEPVWYVGWGERKWYEECGAKNIIESGKLCQSRNKALEDAFKEKKACVQISDDVRSFMRIENGKQKGTTFQEMLAILGQAMGKTGAYLGGIAPTFNPFFAKEEIKERAFVVGDFIRILPCELRFDENLSLKEDYDYTLQHICMYRKICRVDYLMGSFLHRTNAGGAVAYRTRNKELESIEYLKSKWPGVITNSPRGETEIRLKL